MMCASAEQGTVPPPILNRNPTMTTALCWVLVVILFPVVLLLWATESRHTRIQRLRRQGQTWKQIATRYGVSASTARRWAMAA
jgi:hypothetical protein